MLSTYHGYMLGYWTYIAEHTTTDGISFCMNDTFWRFFEMVIINNYHNHHHYISHNLHKQLK